MGSTKKDLEIIYNLQWKSSNGTTINDKSNVVGMYDIPATTLNWETFKSYLLKNSGALVDDVKVSYVNANDKEFPIESQLDFQIALYSFRERARNNDVITLKLEHVWDNKISSAKRQRTQEQRGQESTMTLPQTDELPDWFKNFMKEYKKEIVEEVTTAVVSAMSNIKVQAAGRKSKEAKRLRKTAENNDRPFFFSKDGRKTSKLERKIEDLEEKTNKIKEKKWALECTADPCKQPISSPLSDEETVMDAVPVGPAEVKVTHLTAGGYHRQQWSVINAGSAPWTLETELRYSWGTEALRPIGKIIQCPLLQPGEKGAISIFLQVPREPGEYECYWYFCHNGRRFGHWLGCHIQVDPTPITMLSVHRYNPIEKSITVEAPSAVSWTAQSEKPLNLTKESEPEVANVATALDDLVLISSDSDNQSVISVADSNSSVHTTHSEEFVLVPVKTEPKDEVEVVDPPEDTTKTTGYAYINIDGKKQAVPKKFLRSDYLETAEEADEPQCVNNDSAENKRLFVFPQNCPGFEVVYPPNPMSESLLVSAGSNKAGNDNSSTSGGDVQLWLETEIKSENNKEEKPLTPLNSTTFTTEPTVFPSVAVPVFPTPIAIPPPPPITLPVPPPRTIPVQPPMFTYNPPRATNSWFYPNNPSHTTITPFGHYGQPSAPNPNFQYPYVHNEQFVPTYYPAPASRTPSHYEGEDCATSPNTSPPQTVHMIPETLMSGAVNVASSAINTARSVLNMFSTSSIPQAQPMPPTQQPPEGGTRETALKALHEMGFWDRELNNVLLDRFHDDIGRVVAELVN